MADETPDFEGSIRLITAPGSAAVEFQPSAAAWHYARRGEGEPPWVRIALFDATTEIIHTYPRRTGPSFRMLEEKYAPLREIAFVGFGFEMPASAELVEETLGHLPAQFYTQPLYGFGIRAQFRPMIDTLRRNNLRRLFISKSGKTVLQNDELTLAAREFYDIAYELERIAGRFSDQSLAERKRHAYNELLAKRFPERFPLDNTPFRQGVIVSFLRKARTSNAPISPADRVALVEQAVAEAPEIARRNPRQLYQLRREFELAGLDELIARFEKDVNESHPEAYWQQLLKLNPFIISMLFGHPIVVVRDQAHLGGGGLDGKGDTIADFLVRNGSSQGLALVEIKRPSTPLLGAEFRPGRFKPSSDLNGAIIQVIDQRKHAA